MVKKCVVIDDNEYIRDLMQLFLNHLGYRVETYENIPKFNKDLPYILNWGIELLITDKNVGRYDGLELIKQVRGMEKTNLAAILISGSDFDKEQLKKYKACFLQKPFTIAELKETISSAYKLVGKKHE